MSHLTIRLTKETFSSSSEASASEELENLVEIGPELQRINY